MMALYALLIFFGFAIIGGSVVFLIVRSDAARDYDEDDPPRGFPRG